MFSGHSSGASSKNHKILARGLFTGEKMCYTTPVCVHITHYVGTGGTNSMQYSKEVEEMVCVAKGPNHGPAPIPEDFTESVTAKYILSIT